MSINILAAIFGGMGIGSFLTMIVKHFLDKGRLKTERQAQLQKELYFELQKKAEEVFDGLFILDHRFGGHKIIIEKTLNNQIQGFVELPDDFKKERVKIVTNLQLFFPNISHNKYNECVDLLSETGELYLEIQKKMPLTIEGKIDIKDKEKKIILNSLNQSSKRFESNMIILVNEIKQVLENQKSEIIS